MNRPADSGSILRRLVRLAWPVVGLNTLTVLALAVDTAMVGHLPQAEAALTGLGFATQILFLLMVAMMGLTVGTVAFVSRAHGAGDGARVEHILAQSTWLTVLLGLAVGAAGNLVAAPLMAALGASEQALEEGLRYLRPLLAGTVFSYLAILYAAVLRGVGNTGLPFRISLAANLLNFLLNYGLILGNWGMPALGVLGSALGTLCAQAFTVIALGLAIRRGAVPGLRLSMRIPGLDRDLARDLVRVGLPASLDMLILNAGFLSIIGMLGRLQEVAVAAHGVGMRIQSLAFIPGISISQATGAMVGQALGAGRPDEARQVLRASLGLCAGVMTALAAIIYAAAYPLVALFDVAPGTDLAELSVAWIRMLGLCMPFMGIYVAFVGLFQGAGATRLSLRINAIATFLVQVPLSWLLGFPLGLGVTGVWLGFPLSFAVKVGMGWAAWRAGGWAKVGGRV